MGCVLVRRRLGLLRLRGQFGNTHRRQHGHVPMARASHTADRRRARIARPQPQLSVASGTSRNSSLVGAAQGSDVTRTGEGERGALRADRGILRAFAPTCRASSSTSPSSRSSPTSPASGSTRPVHATPSTGFSTCATPSSSRAAWRRCSNPLTACSWRSAPATCWARSCARTRVRRHSGCCRPCAIRRIRSPTTSTSAP